MSASDAGTLLGQQGWVQQTDGPYFEAWELFWGKDPKQGDARPHNAWTRALQRTSKFGSPDWRLQTLAQLLLNPEGDDVVLPACPFIETPWSDELHDTRGKIAVRHDFERIAHELMSNPNSRTRDGVIAQGQIGVGKTYLAYYLLIRQLSDRRLVIFSPQEDSFVLFHSHGVFLAHELGRDEGGYPALRTIVPKKTWLIMDTPPEQEEPSRTAMDPLFFLIQFCQPYEKHYHYRRHRYSVDFLAVDTPDATTLIAEALIQKDVRPRKDDLTRILEHVHAFGARPRICLQRLSGMKSKLQSLSEYVEQLDGETIELVTRLSSEDWDFSDCVRSTDDPDILLLRCNLTSSPQALVAVLASRLATERLRQHLAFETLLDFANMGVIQSPADGLLDSRYWLFEQLCHTILTTDDADLQDRHVTQLSPRFPLGSTAKAGALRQKHLFHPRSIRAFDADPPTFDLDAYCVPHILQDAAFHAIMYIYPFRRAVAQLAPNAASRPVTRQAAKRAAAAAAPGGAATGSSVTARVTRSTKRARASTRLDDARSPSPLKKPKLKSDRRLVVFLQMMLHAAPDLTESGLERIERIMSVDPFAEYCMVFVTLKDEELDSSAIPAHWADRMKWYQLEVDLPFYVSRTPASD